MLLLYDNSPPPTYAVWFGASARRKEEFIKVSIDAWQDCFHGARSGWCWVTAPGASPEVEV